MNQDDYGAVSDLHEIYKRRQLKEIWRDEATGLPIHMHGHPIKVSEISNDTAQMGNPVACNCGNSFWDISKSVGELVERYKKEKERMTPDPKEQLWPIDDILASLETECMIGVKLEKDGKISSEERRKRIEAAHSVAFNKLALLLDQLRHS